MDPDANLSEQRRIVYRVLDGREEPGDLEQLATLVEALDNWIKGGGFLPREWR